MGVGGGGIIFVSSAVVFREDNALWEPQSWVQPTQKTRPGITVRNDSLLSAYLAPAPPRPHFSPGRCVEGVRGGERGPNGVKQKYRKMVPLRENERGMMEGWSDYRQTLLRLCVVVIFRFELLGRIISSSSPYILRYHHTVIFFFFF